MGFSDKTLGYEMVIGSQRTAWSDLPPMVSPGTQYDSLCAYRQVCSHWFPVFLYSINLFSSLGLLLC